MRGRHRRLYQEKILQDQDFIPSGESELKKVQTTCKAVELVTGHEAPVSLEPGNTLTLSIALRAYATRLGTALNKFLLAAKFLDYS